MNRSFIRAAVLLLSAMSLASCTQTQPTPTNNSSSMPDRVASTIAPETSSLPELPPTPTPTPTPRPYDEASSAPQSSPDTSATPVPTPTPTPTPAPTPTPSSTQTYVDFNAPSVEVSTASGQTLEQWISSNVSGDSDIQRWVLSQYQAAGADTRWQPAIIDLKQRLETALNENDYAGIDYISVTRSASDGYSVTLYTGLQVYTVNDAAANSVIASVMQSYDQSAGKVAVITTHAKRPIARLRELEQEIRRQSFFSDVYSATGAPFIRGFAYEKGGLVVLLSAPFPKLRAFIETHPDGTAIGYRTGDTQSDVSAGASTGSTGSTSNNANSSSFAGASTNYASMGLPSTAGYTSLEQYLNAISDLSLRAWVRSIYQAYDADLGWNNAVASLRGSVIQSLADTEYASVDFRYEIYPQDPNIAIAVGFDVYAISLSHAQSVVNAAKTQRYNENLGAIQIRYTNVGLSKKDLEDTMAQLESQPFFHNKTESGKPYVVGWFIKKGTVEIWLTEKFPALDAWLDAHPNGHAIGYITGKSL